MFVAGYWMNFWNLEVKEMRSNIIALSVLLGLLWAGPSFAQSAIHCFTAADAVGDSNDAREGLRLNHTYTNIGTVNHILRTNGWQSYVGFADTVQVYYIDPGRYMLMASIQGCHVAHAFVEESALARMKATFDVSQTKPSSAPTPA